GGRGGGAWILGALIPSRGAAPQADPARHVRSARRAASRIRGAACAGLRGLPHRQRARHARRLDRARDQLLDGVPEVPLARARRLRGDLALAAVLVVLIRLRRARRPLQPGLVLFMRCSLAWGVLFTRDTLAVWHAVVICTAHGIAGVLWGPSSQLLIHDIVGHARLHSAVRLMSMSRVVGLLGGPAIGG